MLREPFNWQSWLLVFEPSDAERLKPVYLLCLVMSLTAHTAEAVREEEASHPTRLLGLDEITVVMLMVCVTAIALSEAAKAIGRYFMPEPGLDSEMSATGA